MELRTALVVLLTVSLLVENTEAGWKFWKKKKDKDEETTVSTLTSSTTASTPVIRNPAPAAGGKKPGATSTSTTSNINKALASAADPGLAIGVGASSGGIRSQKPNPGTEVGLDISAPRPNKPGVGGNSGQGYRDWAADLTGAGDPTKPRPKLPSEGPALSSGGQQPPSPGSKPSSLPNSPTGQQTPSPGNRPSSLPVGQQTPSPVNRPGTPSSTTVGQPTSPKQQPPPTGPRPGSPASAGPVQQGGQPAAGQPAQYPKPATVAPIAQGGTDDGKPQVSTLHIGSISPGSRPGSPTSPVGVGGNARPQSPSSPTGGKTWADIAAGGTRSPTPAPRSNVATGGQARHGTQSYDSTGSISPGGSAGSRPGSPQIAVQPYGQPGHQGSQQPGRTSPSTGGTIAAGAVAGAAAGAAANTVFSSNPTYSKGNTITDDDLRKLSEALFIKDVNNANRHITLNLQKHTSGSSPTDEAPQPLLNVKPEALQIPTIQKVLTIYDNYKLDTRVNEYISPAQRQEESLLVDTFLSTNVMSTAMRFLADKSLVRKDYYEYKDTLRRIWFNLFSRGDGKIGSTGFEHVFMTELKLGTEVSGLHNWIYFNAEEVKKRADYLGYIKKIDLGNKAAIVKIHTRFDGIDKPVTTMFIGTSPELEMALYTVCFFSRPDSVCPVSLGGTQFNIQTHKFRYRGKDLVGSAYPDI